MTCLVTKHLKFEECSSKFIRYLSHNSLTGREAAIASFPKSLDSGIPSLKFRLYLFIESMATNSKTFQLQCESSLNFCRTSNVWLPCMSCLRPIRTCFSVTCLRLNENDSMLYKVVLTFAAVGETLVSDHSIAIEQNYELGFEDTTLKKILLGRLFMSALITYDCC